MVKIPEPLDPTIEAMYRAIEAGQDRSKRDYLGASTVGHPCARQVYYTYHFGSPDKEWRGLLAIEDGHRSEDLAAQRLRMVRGIELHTHDQNGEQYGFSDFDGKFKGHYDGLIKGLWQAHSIPHVWECKATNEKGYKAFEKAKKEYGEKNALENWNKSYYVQAQLYMHYSGYDRHYLTVSYAGGREYSSCRTEYDAATAEQYRDRAYKIINATQPPPRIREEKDFWMCRLCQYKERCHG